MLSPLILAALVELVKSIFTVYLPQVPITAEFINSVLVIVIGWFGLEAVKFGVSNFMPSLNKHFK